MLRQHIKFSWQMTAGLILLAIGLASFVFISNVNFNCLLAASKSQKILIGEYINGENIEKIESLLLKSSVRYALTREPDISPLGDRPRFSIASIKIDDANIRESTGSLRLDFLNEHLYRVVFSTIDLAQADVIYKEITNKKIDGKKCHNIKGIEFCISRISGPAATISASDMCTVDKIDSWIGRWS
ncbi:hypothetical protein ACFX58_15640 [Sphingomonas sp. NCPPB 2930]